MNIFSQKVTTSFQYDSNKMKHKLLSIESRLFFLLARLAHAEYMKLLILLKDVLISTRDIYLPCAYAETPNVW